MRSDALSCYLIQQLGFDKTQIVVYGHKQNEMLICFIACVKAGHAYIPIDSSFPKDRVLDIIQNSKTNLIFNLDELNYSSDIIEIIDMENVHDICNKYYGRSPDKCYSVRDNNLYYIIYTSRSTGIPKGVQITLGCLESFIKWAFIYQI